LTPVLLALLLALSPSREHRGQPFGTLLTLLKRAFHTGW
jgi:hypothetical protein